MSSAAALTPASLLLAPSPAKFTRFKWLVAGVLAVSLVLLWVTGAGTRADDDAPAPLATAPTPRAGAGPGTGTGPGAPTTASRPGGAAAGGAAGGAASGLPAGAAAGAGSGAASGAASGVATQAGADPASLLIVPTLVIERAVDGRLTVSGSVPDDATRDQWLNAVRIASQGQAVSDALRVSPLTRPAPWAEHLRAATALLRDRRLDSIAFEGDRLTLRGPRVAGAYREETERLFREGVPSVASVSTAGASLGAGSLALNAPTAATTAGTGGADPQGARGAPGVVGATGAPTSEGGGPASLGGRAPAGPQALPGAPARAAAGAGAVVASGPAGASGASGASSAASTAPAPARRGAAAACPSKIGPLAATVYFQSDSASLTRAERERLERLGQCLGKRTALVTGHTDNRHSKTHNLDLSRRRAEAVAAAIVAGGASGKAVETRAVGESRPAVSGNDAKARQRNRRVEIRLR
ncbi:MAG: OmpA family protein [Lautropia sp.]